MKEGKITSQAGHAFVGAFLQCQNKDIISEYHQEFPKSPGTKVCLKVPNLAQLHKIENEVRQLGIPTYVVVDSGCPNFFNGEPIVTALGIGPATKEQLKNITGELKLL